MKIACDKYGNADQFRICHILVKSKNMHIIKTETFHFSLISGTFNIVVIIAIIILKNCNHYFSYYNKHGNFYHVRPTICNAAPLQYAGNKM